WKSTSHAVGASAWYTSPAARPRRNARCAARWAGAPIVVYVVVQSTDRPSRRQTASYACSSIAVSRVHSSTKLRRDIRIGGCLRSAAVRGGIGSGISGSYGNDGSQRTL